jgi:SAM-dependent methyltransferase
MFGGNLDAYLTVGRSALHAVETLLNATGRQDPEKILDLPCGHGRVMRHLRARWPDAWIVGCDLDRGGVDYCAERFGSVPRYSERDPRRIPIHESFDLIWVGSLLTHLDAPLWRLFLDFFTERLGDRGLLVFTTTGRYNTWGPKPKANVAEGYAREGFGYWEPPDSPGYGGARASPAWVTSLLAAYPHRMVCYWERGWNDHQDVVALSAEAVEADWQNPSV